jgi:hypothetical protein
MDITTSTDPVLARLPAQAQKKLAHLRKIETRARALADGFAAQYEKAREALSAAQSDLAHFDRRHGHRVPDDDPARLALVQQVEEVREQLRGIREEHAGGTGAGFSVDQIVNWVRAQGSRAMFKPLQVKPRLAKGERASDALERNRHQQMAARERLANIANAPRTRAELHRGIRDEIAALALRGTPEVSDTGEVRWPQTQVVTVAEGVAAAASIPDTVAILVWALGPDQIAKRLDAALASHPEDAGAMSVAEQRAAASQAQAELLRLQYEGEALATLLEGDGVFVRRDTGTPIPVLLGVELQ